MLVLLGGFSEFGFAQSGKVEAILAIAVAGTVMSGCYLGLLVLARNPELSAVARPLVNRFVRRGTE